MAKSSLQIDLLGTSFAIQSDERPEHLQNLYSYLKKTVSQIESTSGVKDPVKIALIAGLLISDELYKEKMKRTDTGTLDLSVAERKTLEMISRIDQVIS